MSTQRDLQIGVTIIFNHIYCHNNQQTAICDEPIGENTSPTKLSQFKHVNTSCCDCAVSVWKLQYACKKISQTRYWKVMEKCKLQQTSNRGRKKEGAKLKQTISVPLSLILKTV